MQGFNDRSLFERFKHSPYRLVHYKEYYRLLTSGFLHGSWVHLLVNLFVENFIFISVFGKVLGSFLYLLLVLLAIVVGNIPSTIKHKNDMYYGAIGLSGAVSAILFSYVLISPWSKIYLYAIIPIYTVVAAILYLVYSQWAANNSRDNVDHSAHFYGAIFGLVYTIAVYPAIVPYFIERLIQNFPF